MDTDNLDRCALGCEYDVAKCAFHFFGVEHDRNALSVRLSEEFANKLFERASFWISFSLNPDAGGLTREISQEKARRIMDVHNKLKTAAFKKLVIAQYQTILDAQGLGN